MLQEALARDKVDQAKLQGEKLAKKDAIRDTSAFIQIIHKYRDSFIDNENIPPEHIAIFDEAQRAWTQKKIAQFMATKKGISFFHYSEPEFLISTMNRHNDWSVIVCLIGGGQEINDGEAGLPEWFNSLKRSFIDWDVFVTPQLNDIEYRHSYLWSEMIDGLKVSQNTDLHLSTSMRSFRTASFTAFVNAILELNKNEAKQLYSIIRDKYPILLTRELSKAKAWVKERCRGTMRYGLIASSGALRLKPDGIFVKNLISVSNWFLNGKNDIRSSYALEDVVTEFDIQGLEIDYSILAWDADFRIEKNEWTYNSFIGDKWTKIKSEINRMYLKNTYRVLMTRAREGLAIFIPEGNDEDTSRKKIFYDETYNFLKDILD